jgi:hypothetical protein
MTSMLMVVIIMKLKADEFGAVTVYLLSQIGVISPNFQSHDLKSAFPQ